MNTWITTDWHMNHENIKKYEGRPDNFEELIIENHRKLIKPEDTMIHLGDTIFARKQELKEYLSFIECRSKILVRGNHDDHFTDSWLMNQGFNVVCDAMVIRGILLSHAPIKLSDDIVTMNLPYLYSACKGMFHEKMKRIQSQTSGTQGLVDKFGYDTKQALHAFRILDFIVRFYEFNWDFKEAMTYTNDCNFGTSSRNGMMLIKQGNYTLQEFKQCVNNYCNNDFLALEEVYKSQQPNVATKDKLDGLIKELVRRNI